MAPEEHITTRWPARRRPTAVSTMVESVLSKGSWVFSSTMDDVPGKSVSGVCSQAFSGPVLLYTELYYNGKVTLHLACCVSMVVLDEPPLCLVTYKECVNDIRLIVLGRAHTMVHA